MNFTIIGDPHVKNGNLDLFWELAKLVEDKGNPAIWLGDFLDTKEVIRGKCINALIDYFKSSKLYHTILIGNHDWFNLDCKEHSLEALKLLSNVTIIDTPAHTPGQIGYLPYIHDREELKKAIKQMEKDHVRILIAHLELPSFDFGNGHICKDGLSLKSLSKFKHVISGHFHKHQQKDNITYPGTPFSHTFGEANQIKCIGTLNTKTGDLKLETTPFRRHISIEFDCDLLDKDKAREKGSKYINT